MFSKLYFPKIAAGDRAAKKKYAGKIAWKRGRGVVEPQELEIVGLEAIRSDTPEAFRGLQTTLLDLMFKEATVEELISIVLLFKKALFSGDIHPLDLTISKTIAKKSYKVKPHHVQAAEKSGQQYNFGDKVSYLYTPKNGVVIDH